MSSILRKRLLRALVPVLSMTALMGCSKDDSAISGSLTLEVSDLTPTTVTVRIDATNPKMNYLCSYFEEAQYVQYGPDGNIQAFIDNLLVEIEDTYPEFTREEVLARLMSTGASTETYRYLKPATPYYLYAVGLDARGVVTTAVFSEELVMPASSGASPEVSLEITVGDDQGRNPSSRLTGTIQTSGVAYGQGYFERKDRIDSLVGTGLNYEKILGLFGLEFPKENVDQMNGGQMRYIFASLKPVTEYMFMMQIVSEGGCSAIVAQSCTTATDHMTASEVRAEMSGIPWPVTLGCLGGW